MNIGDRILGLRKMEGISQEELADKVGVSRQAVSKWEGGQSTPDLEKVIIMSEYFDVTTDYLLKGTEVPQENKNFNASQILYIASTAFLAIGLLTAFGSWYTEQSGESIWGSMIIQVVGVTAYFIGRLISQSKAPFIINWLNIVIGMFMPIALIVTLILNGAIAPYPNNTSSSFVFIVVYILIIILSFLALKKNRYHMGK